MGENQYKRASLEDVLVLTLRLTLFHVAPLPLLTQQEWRDITGTEVDNFIQSKSKGELRADAPFGAGVLQYRQTNVRSDLLYTPPTHFDEVPSSAPTIGSITDVLDPFLRVANSWIEKTNNHVKRMALGIIAIIPADDMDEAYDRLAPYIPALHIEPRHTTDLLYQVNHPRPSHSVEHLIINRLTKWSVATLGLDIETKTGPVESSYPLVFVDLDINTDAMRKEPLDREQQTTILGELASLAKEIISEGDVI